MKLFVIPFLFFSGHLFASGVSVSAQVSKDTVALNETFTFSIRIQYAKVNPGSVEIPNLSYLDDFHVLNQWSGTQTSMSSRKGKTEWRNVRSHNYQLQPKTKGKLRIDSLQVKVGGKIFNTKPFFIHVKEKTTKKPNPSNPLSPLPNLFPAPHSQLFDQLFKNEPLGSQIPLKKAFKLELNVDKKSIYVGEMVKVDWILLMSLGNAQYREDKAPSLRGFWKEPLVDRGNHQFLGTQIKDNVLYRKMLLDSQALFPVKEGVLEIDAYQVKIMYPFGARWKEEVRKTPSRNLFVKPLPLEGRDRFSGAVGSFKVKAFLNQEKTQVNQPVTFHLRFEGTGHPRSIHAPSIPFPQGLKAYPPTEKSKFSIKKKSYKEFEILLVPQKTGDHTIPSFSLTTFDPSLERYVSHVIPAISLQVQANQKKSEEDKISFFDQAPDVSSSEGKEFFLSSLKKKWLFYFNQRIFFKFWMIFYSLLILGFILFYFYPSKSKNKKHLKRQIQLKFKVIEKTLAQKQSRASAVYLTNLIFFVLSELGQAPSSQEWNPLLESLPPSLYQKFSQDLQALVSELEALSFAPQTPLHASQSLKTVHKLSHKAKTLLEEMVNS